MGEQDPNDQQLERALTRALRELPPLRAPATLESRVYAELARRAALPWWRQSFSHWPGMARATFLLFCTSLGLLTGVRGVTAGLGSLPGWRQLSAVAGAGTDAVASLVYALPTAWLYESLGLAAVLYAVLFALGAAAYRTLYLHA